jgi:hypothetical protein
MCEFRAAIWSASFIFILLCEIPTAAFEFDENDKPKIFLTHGHHISCAESASLLLEYEVWHVDPQESVTVQMYMYHLDNNGEILSSKQTLIEKGGLPSGEVMLSRMKEGRYLVILELLRVSEDSNEVIATGNSTLGQFHVPFNFK